MEKKNYMAPQSWVIKIDMPPFCANPSSIPVNQSGSTDNPLSRDEDFFSDDNNSSDFTDDE